MNCPYQYQDGRLRDDRARRVVGRWSHSISVCVHMYISTVRWP